MYGVGELKEKRGKEYVNQPPCEGGSFVQHSMYMNEIFVQSDIWMYFSNCTKSK